MKTLVTGAAGFIGYHLCKRLLNSHDLIIGFDNLNDYYSKSLKIARIRDLESLSKRKNKKFVFVEGDICEFDELLKIFKKYKPFYVVHMAAQAGVRYSIENPLIFTKTNMVGFSNILEISAKFSIKHLIYASSSSVYGGGNDKSPLAETHAVNHPVSLYAASKRSNELMAHCYSHLYNLPTSGIRFFTVYGPWGRPDMALFLFTKNIIENKPIKIFNNGSMARSFTYIDDVIESLERIIFKIPSKENQDLNTDLKPNNSWAPFKLLNVGSSKSESLLNYIEVLEDALQKKAKKIYLPMQKGDVKITHSDSKNLEEWIGYHPSTSINVGIKNFVEWYKSYYQ